MELIVSLLSHAKATHFSIERFGIDWTKDHETDKTKGYLYPSSGDAFKESVWAFKTSPKDTVVSKIASSPIVSQSLEDVYRS